MFPIEKRYRLAEESGALGLSCGADGLSFAGAPLFRQTGEGFEPRPAHEIEALIGAAYGSDADPARLSGGLTSVAKALNLGELGLAKMAALHLRLPDLDPDGAARVAGVQEALAKANFNPAEDRDEDGEWTSDGGSGGRAPQDPRACNNQRAVVYVNNHRDDAARIAAALNVPTANILGLSAAESEWGTGRFAKNGNNYFSQHAGSGVPFTTGSMPSGKDGLMAKFASYYDSARAFAVMYGHAVRGLSDPTAFAQALVRAKFNTGRKATGGRDNYVSYTADIISMTERRMRCSR